MADALLLASGGLDSTTLAFWLEKRGKSVHALFFDYGQHCVEKEWNTLLEVLPSSIDVPQRICIREIFRGSPSRLIKEANLWEEQISADDLYVPYRTLLFSTIGVARAQSLGVSEVYSGFINSNHAKELDCTSDFLNNLGALSEQVGEVKLMFPFRELSKKDVVNLALELGVPVGRTFSCQVFSDVPCGVCPNCVDRIEGIKQAAIDE